MLIKSSDSSMDDCNHPDVPFEFIFKVVQIPLWTIVTAGGRGSCSVPWCSDSSMDDCNGNLAHPDSLLKKVQIPLWTIVTSRLRRRVTCAPKFRFLYGRL